LPFLRFALSFLLTLSLVLVLDRRMGVAPPFGKFLNPFSGCWQQAEAIGAEAEIPENIPGLRQPARVYFDHRRVPHVFAENELDLYFLQGYLTARDRLWQMEIQTHSAAGRISEIMGPSTLEYDRNQRRIGLVYAAEEAEAFIRSNPESVELIEAYSQGVNAWINSLDQRTLPLEYKLLDYQPEAWTPLKTALLLKNMALMLSATEWDIENTNAMALLGRDQFNRLFPEYFAGQDPIVPTGTSWNFTPIPPVADSLMEKPIAAYTQSQPKSDAILGSNNWAVSGKRSKTGRPILCNDPHLKLSLPSIWYEMHLVCPGMNVYGVTLPGAPAVIIGFNESVAWGVTNAGRDVRDWHRISFKDHSKTAYKLNGKWTPSRLKIERIKLRGAQDFLDTVAYTLFGPVVYDHSFGKFPNGKGNPLALQWTAFLGSNEFLTFYHLNKAGNYQDYLHALDHYSCPAQNFVFASVAGDIAIREQGRFPVLQKEQGKFVLNGELSSGKWNRFIPYDQNPGQFNPERGFVSSANQHPFDTSYPYYSCGIGPFEYFRNRRINRVLASDSSVSAADMRSLQNDNLNLLAEELLPVLLKYVDRKYLRKDDVKALGYLAGWNFRNDPEQKAAVFFSEWFTAIQRVLWDELLLQDSLALRKPSSYASLRFISDVPESPFYDYGPSPEKENRAQMLALALKQSIDSLKSKNINPAAPPDWGTYKATVIQHLARLDAFSRLNIRCGGDLGIVNATNKTHGPSWRMIAELGGKKWGIYPGGPSGNPGSPFYDNMVNTWAKGEYDELLFPDQKSELEAMIKKGKLIKP